MQCERCLNKFEYDELDLVNGDWICNQCEEDIKNDRN